jgi:hypothetical protein
MNIKYECTQALYYLILFAGLLLPLHGLGPSCVFGCLAFLVWLLFLLMGWADPHETNTGSGR